MLYRYVHAHFRHPLRLAWRVARSGGPEGRFALLSVPLGLIAAPLDLALQPLEQRIYRRFTEPRRPMVLVCGPPRSGTSVVAAALIRSLPVGYVSNFMALFPRSPLTANRLFGIRQANSKVGLKTYYGRSQGLRSQNDGLFLWDRWLGKDRTELEPVISPDRGRAMRRFWAAFEVQCQKPIITKNNNPVAYASTVAASLPNVHFLCLKREPIYLAQSLLLARSQIHGDPQVPYGLQGSPRDEDPVMDVCRQVRFYEQATQEQLASLGAERFLTVSYEEFCRDPGALVHQVATRILGLEADLGELQDALPPVTVHNRRRVSSATFEALAEGLQSLGVTVTTEALLDDGQETS